MTIAPLTGSERTGAGQSSSTLAWVQISKAVVGVGANVGANVGEVVGNVADVLELVATDTKEMHMLQRERRASMAAYTSVIYIAFGVFLVTVLILQSTFLAQMEAVGQQTQAIQQQSGGNGLPGGGVQGATISAELIPAIRDIYFYAAIVHAIGDGVLAGVIQAGKFSAGMIHAFVMLLGAFVTLRILS